MAKTNSTTELGFEDKIWKAADLLRGNIDASARGTRKARLHCLAFSVVWGWQQGLEPALFQYTDIQIVINRSVPNLHPKV